MLTTLHILNLIKKAHGNCSDYRAAQLLDVTKQTPSAWIHRGSVMSDETAIKAAVLLKMEPLYVLACAAAERTRGTDAFPVWQSFIESMTPPKIPKKYAA